MNHTGNIISQLRREAGYSQKGLATALHITDKAVSKWERGISLPDVSLLPKLSLLLGADIELLLAKEHQHQTQNWLGLLDLRECDFDLSQILFDKPAVYYLLSHYLLLGITKIYIRTTEENKRYLQSKIFCGLGFSFEFDFTELPMTDLMIMNRPCFLFGSDLTRLFQGAMVTEMLIKANPLNSTTPFLFCPASYTANYLDNPDSCFESASEKNFGRGMLCIEMGTPEHNNDISNFIDIYQKNTGLLIGCLEEIAFNKNIISGSQLLSMTNNKPYQKMLLDNLLIFDV